MGAKDAYEEALKVEPGNAQAKQGLKAVDDAIAREAAEDGQSPDLGLGQVTSLPPPPQPPQCMWGTDH